MTKQEIMAALDGLKDLTNESGKHQIESIKAGVNGLEDVRGLWVPKVRQEAEQEPEPELVAAGNYTHDNPEQVKAKRPYHRKK